MTEVSEKMPLMQGDVVSEMGASIDGPSITIRRGEDTAQLIFFFSGT
jgi:hypothetical protein